MPDPSPVARRSFVAALIGTPPALMLCGSAAGRPALPRGGDDDSGSAPVHGLYPTTDPALVREIVGVAHVNVARVRTLVEQHPALARASWDWGFGDWESALGAASHMGNREIAAVLIDHGARPDLFTAAMMDHVAVVRAAVEATPDVQRIPGPHGITLMQHATNGKAARVAAYLEAVGGADDRGTGRQVDGDEAAPYLGAYPYGHGPTEIFHVKRQRSGAIGIEREGAIIRRLLHIDGHSFYPSGSPAVRIHFDVAEGRARSLTIHDHVEVLTAVRRD